MYVLISRSLTPVVGGIRPPEAVSGIASTGCHKIKHGVTMTERIKEYECCALFKPDLEPEQLDAEVEAVRALLSERAAEVARVDRWNKRFLAYPIKDYTEGYYVIYRWFGTKDVLPDLDYQLKYNENCLRHLVLDYTEKERKRRKRLGKAKAAKV